MTIANAIELGTFIAKWVTAVVEKGYESFARDEPLTVEGIEHETNRIIDDWNRAKAEHWRIVHRAGDERRSDTGE